MADPADNSKYTVDDIIRLAAEVDDPCQAAALAEAATALREMREREDRLDDARHLHDLIVDLAERAAGDVKSNRGKAKRLKSLGLEYDAGDWQEHQHRSTTPPDLSEIDELLWWIFSKAGAMPSRESLRKILAGRYYF